MLLPRSTRVHASASVAIVNKARNLGAWFDLLLNFNVHITKTCSLSFCSLYKIRRIRKYLSYKSAQTLILALVIGRLDYCNSLLYGLPASYIIKLQRVQNAAARPVKYRMMFKLAVYTFKALHGIAPTYIHQLIRLKPQSNYNMRSNTKHLLLDLPNKTKKTTGDRAFFAAATTLWNALPDELRALGSLKTFMARLETHYFILYI